MSHPESPKRTGTTPRRTTLITIALSAAAFALGPLSVTPLVATAGAQGSVLEQAQGGAATPRASSPGPRATAGGGSAQAILNPKPNWSAPGMEQGGTMIGWSKAGALVLAVLSLTLLVPLAKFLKSAGNHNSEGVRSGVSGALAIAALSGMGASLVLFIAG